MLDSESLRLGYLCAFASVEEMKLLTSPRTFELSTEASLSTRNAQLVGSFTRYSEAAEFHRPALMVGTFLSTEKTPLRVFSSCQSCLMQTVDSYYRQSSCAPVVTSIRVPLLAVSALDDPICTQEAIPRDEIRLNPNVVLATAARGGHLAIYEGWLPTQVSRL